MNVLGVLFDNKLNWNDQIARSISKANSILHCIRLIKYYLNPDKLLKIITSNYYSVLNYNSEIWNIPHISTILKTKTAFSIRKCSKDLYT